MDRAHAPVGIGLELVEELHRLEHAERLPGGDDLAHLDERRRARPRGTVEDADHRRLDADHPACDGGLGRVVELGDRDGRRRDRPRLVRAPHGDAHSLVLDLDLADAGLLDDLDELADALPALSVDVAAEERPLARVTLADRLQERLRLLAEHREQDEILLRRRKPIGGLADVVHARRIVVERGRLAGQQLDGAAHAGVDLARRRSIATRHELAELVEHGAVATRRQHVEKRLRSQDQPDRRGERRPARLVADPHHLDERFEQSIARRLRAEVDVERRDEAGREVVLRRTDGDTRRERGERLVAEVLVHDVRCLPEARDVDARRPLEPLEHLHERLAGDAVQRQRERVDRGRDNVGPDAGRHERVGERRASGRLDVEADGQAARLAEALDELLRHVREEPTGRVVQQDPRRAEGGHLSRLLDQRVDLAVATGAVDEPDVELTTRLDDRLPRLDEVRDVVQRVVEPEDVDPVLGRARDEPAHDVRRDGLRADEEPAAQGEPERRRRAGVDRADPLPGALDASPHGRVEDAAARHLEAREPGAVEDLRDAEHLARGDAPGQRLLRQQADRGVVELRHDAAP